MALPNFIIFGGIKCGTGALHQYLDHHPDIYCSPNKEPRFFTRELAPPTESETDHHFDPLEDYRREFAGATNQTAIGEATSNYIYHPAAARRIAETLPDVRLIASLRDPVDRAIAHLRMSNNRLPATSTELEAARTSGWATASLYARHLKPYTDIFSPDQIKVVIMEEWVADPKHAMTELFDYLGVDTAFELPERVRYPAGQVSSLQRSSILKALKPYVPKEIKNALNRVRASRAKPNAVDADVRRAMHTWYTDDVRELENMLGRDLSVWSA